jgi:hypothetical protein
MKTNTMTRHSGLSFLQSVTIASLAAVAALLVASPALALTISPSPPNATSTDTTATISWTTDVGASSQVTYGTTTAYTATSTLAPSLVTSHSVLLTGLAPNTLYHFAAMSEDASSTATTSPDATFMTLTTPVITPTSTPPVISAIVPTPTDTSATIAWSTDQAASSRVLYGTTTSYGGDTGLNSSLVFSHSVPLSGLTPSTLYHFIVTSANASGTPATSTDMTFTTLATPTTTPPSGSLQDQVDQLRARIVALEHQVELLLQQLGGMHGSGNDSQDNNGHGSPDHGKTSVHSGGSADFGKHPGSRGN